MVTASPTVSVVIVNYNSGDRLARVLSALKRQSWQDFDVVVVDNASTDSSVATLENHHDLVTVKMSTVNTGFAGGVMQGAALAHGEWLAFLNPDAYPEPGWLEALMTAARQYGPHTVLGCVQLTEGKPDILDGLGDTYHASGVAWRGGFGKPAAPRLPDGDREIFAACFAAALVHRERFAALGGLDEDFFCYHEDVDFGFRHRLAGGRAILVRDAVVHHEGSGITGRYSDFTVYHGIRNRMWTLVKNTPAPLLPLMIPLYLVFSAGFLVRSAMLGIARPYLRGMAAGLRGLAAQWAKRRDVGRHRTVSALRIARSMTWSPIAPFRRAADLRPVSPPFQQDD